MPMLLHVLCNAAVVPVYKEESVPLDESFVEVAWSVLLWIDESLTIVKLTIERWMQRIVPWDSVLWKVLEM